MTDAKTIRIDVREAVTELGARYYWVLQSTGPVQDLAKGMTLRLHRHEAIADFEEVARILGWKTYVGVEGAAVIEEDAAR